MSFIWNFLFATGIIWILAGVLFGVLLNMWKGFKKPEWIEKMATVIFAYIEMHYKEWNIFKNDKMTKAVEIFLQQYRKVYGKDPSEQEKELFQMHIENKVLEEKR